MLTGVTEITRNASSASRGLVMISSRLTQVLDDSSSTGKKLTKIYSDLGIELLNEEGQLRSHYDILGDLAKQWDSLSENQQKYIALTSAGARQQQNFVALMANWNQVAKATNTAYESMGSAQRENEKVMDSIAKKVEILRSEFQQLVIGEGGLQDFAKTILDIGIAILKFTNSDIGQFLVALVAVETSIVLLQRGFIALSVALKNVGIVQAIKDIIALSNGQMIATSSTFALAVAQRGLARAIWETTAAWLASPLGMVTVGAAVIVGLIAVTKKLNAELSESTKRLEEYSQSYKNAEKNVDDLTNALKDIDEQIKKVNAKKLTITDSTQLTELEKESSELKEQEKTISRKLALAKQELEIARQLAEIEAKRNLQSKTASQFQRSYGSSGQVRVTAQEELNLAIEKHKELSATLEQLKKEQYEYAQSKEYDAEKFEEYNNKISDVEAQLAEVDARGVEMANTLQQDADALTSTDESTQNLKESTEELVDKWQEVTGYQEDAEEQIQQTTDEIEEEEEEVDELSKELENLIQSLGITATEFKGLKKAFGDNEEILVSYLRNLADVRQSLSDTSTVIDNLQDALTAAQTALDEYNEKGYLTIDTFQSLMGISAQYLATLVNENGQLEINQTTLGNLIDQLKIAKIEELAHAAAMEIAALQYDDTNTSAGNAQKAVDAAGDAFTRAGDKAAKASAGLALFNAELDKATGGTAGDYTGQEKVIIEKYRKLAKEIATLNVNTTAAGNAASSAGKKGSKAAKDAKDATEELNKELEETKKKYDKVISWISKQYDKEIDKIKKAKDEAVKAEEEKIKAKEKEKDAALDAIEAEIRALEKEKNALKEQKEALDDRKQALKDEEDTLVKGIEKRIKALEKERDALIKPVEERIKALEKERDAIVDSTQAEIDALNELKEIRQTYWDEQINALKKANEELKENLTLQEKLDALEKAKNTKVKIYKEGQGFVYDVDQNAVQQAQKALDEYLSEKAYEDELARLESLKNAEIQSYDDRLKELTDYKDNTKKIYDQQIEDLKNYKDSVKENYDEQIENLKEYKEAIQEQYEEQIEIINQDIDALEKHMDELDKHKDALEEHKDAVEAQYEAEIAELEAHKDAVEKAYDAEIQMWETYKQEFENMVNAYEEEQNRLLFEQLTGIKAENSNWMTRLDNLAKFVNEYNKLQQQLETDNTNVQNTASFDSGSNSVGSSSPRSNNSATPRYDDRGFKLNDNVSSKPKYDSRGFKLNYAKGASSIPNDQIAIVGENPNQELVIGSKLNGQTMSLNKGTGVVNAESTNTLAGMLNQVGKYGNSRFGGGNGTLNNNYNNDSLVINGVTIQGANIKDPQTFVNSLLNLKSEALQRAYQHK